MESEKVKEIKKGLKDHSIEKLKYQDGIKIKEIDFTDILALINELEKKNERLLDSVETVQNNRCVYKCELAKKQLKQFAEMLKGKFDEQKHFYETASISHRDISIMALNTAYKYLDETLKEVLGEKKIECKIYDKLLL